MQADEVDGGSIGLQICCPVPGCTYTHESVQGIAGHVGNGHEDGWEAAVASPTDVHEAVSLANPGDALRVAKVRAWLEQNEVPTELFRVYIDQRFGTVQVRHIGGVEGLYAIKVATSGVDAYHYNGEVGWFDNEFVTDLPELKMWPAVIPDNGTIRFEEHPECSVEGCEETNGVNHVLDETGAKRLACRSHAKEVMRVSS